MVATAVLWLTTTDNCMGPYGITWDYMGNMGLNGTTWDYMGLLRLHDLYGLENFRKSQPPDL